MARIKYSWSIQKAGEEIKETRQKATLLDAMVKQAGEGLEDVNQALEMVKKQWTRLKKATVDEYRSGEIEGDIMPEFEEETLPL